MSAWMYLAIGTAIGTALGYLLAKWLDVQTLGR